MRSFVVLVICSLLARAHAESCARDDEPGLPMLLRRAVARAALEPERIASSLRRARVAAILPRLQARADKGAYAYLRDPTSTDGSLASANTWQVEGLVMWQLDRLIYNPSEARAIESSGRLAEHRAVLLDRVVQLWSTRRALSIAAAPTESSDPVDDCIAFTALLDELTGGALSTEKNPRRPPSTVSQPTKLTLPDAGGHP